jgi:hypothetical protein
MAMRTPDAAKQLRAELAEAKAEIAELRTQLRATAALAAGIGFRTQPASTSLGAAATTVKQLCQVNGVHPDHAAAITKLFG